MKKSTFWKALCLWALFLVMYLLMTASHEPAEIAAGTILAALVLVPVLAIRRKSTGYCRMRPAWLIPMLQIPWATLQETWLLYLALWNQVRGRPCQGSTLRYQERAPEDEYTPARRAFLTFGVCITPNSYLVHLDREKRTALVRQLVGKKLSTIDRKFLELP